MKLFKLIELDLESERKRILKRGRYNKRQQKALLKLCELLESGEWQKCLDHINDEKAFPDNPREEYNEREHISTEIDDLLRSLPHFNFYTQDQLLKEAQEKLSASAGNNAEEVRAILQ